MGLTVATLTSGRQPELLERAVRSVEQALPVGAKHLIVHCPTIEEFVKQRHQTLLEDDYVAIVDDDDEIHPQSLTLCYEAIKKNDVGLVCTNEVQIFSGGNFSISKDRKTYDSLYRTITQVHHLCVFNSKYIDHHLSDLYSSVYFVDWFLRANTALTGGALHIQMPGYYWYRDRTTGLLPTRRIELFRSLLPTACDEIRDKWGGRTGNIPIYQPSTSINPYIPESLGRWSNDRQLT